MEEARMAIAETRMVTAETLNVTHSIDDKVAVIVDGGRDTFSGHTPIPKRQYGRYTTVCEHRR
jgi:hypothetical protein